MNTRLISWDDFMVQNDMIPLHRGLSADFMLEMFNMGLKQQMYTEAIYELYRGFGDNPDYETI